MEPSSNGHAHCGLGGSKLERRKDDRRPLCTVLVNTLKMPKNKPNEFTSLGLILVSE
jgi:hypothetical protein